MLRLGMIGLGAIGAEVLAAADRGALGGVRISAVLVRQPRAAARTAPVVTADPDVFFAQGLDAVLECAGHRAVREHGLRALESGAALLLTSVGALVEQGLLDRLLAAAQRRGSRLIIPSAGIGALDILSGVARSGLYEVTVTVRKDAASWRGTAAESAHHLDRLVGPVVLFDGPVREGARLYPQNVNIAAAVALAGIGFDRTRLVILADPAIDSHIVEIAARGAFGRFDFREEVVPSESNRKTGKLVAMAVVKAVNQLASPLVIGA